MPPVRDVLLRCPVDRRQPGDGPFRLLKGLLGCRGLLRQVFDELERSVASLDRFRLRCGRPVKLSCELRVGEVGHGHARRDQGGAWRRCAGSEETSKLRNTFDRHTVVEVTDLGGFISEIDGGRNMMANGSIVAANDQLHAPLQRMLHKAGEAAS